MVRGVAWGSTNQSEDRLSMRSVLLTTPGRATTQIDILRSAEGVQVPVGVELDTRDCRDEGQKERRERGNGDHDFKVEISGAGWMKRG